MDTNAVGTRMIINSAISAESFDSINLYIELIIVLKIHFLYPFSFRI